MTPVLSDSYRILDKAGNNIPYFPAPVQAKIHSGLNPRSLIVCARVMGTHTALLIDAIDKARTTPGQKVLIIAPNARLCGSYAERMHFLIRNAAGSPKLTLEYKNRVVFENGSAIEVSCRPPRYDATTDTPPIDRLFVFHFDLLEKRDQNLACEVLDFAEHVQKSGKIVLTMNSPDPDSEARLVALRAYKRGSGYLYFWPWWKDADKMLPVATDWRAPCWLFQYAEGIQTMAERRLTSEQLEWYLRTAENIGRDNMKREYPSFIEEALFS